MADKDEWRERVKRIGPLGTPLGWWLNIVYLSLNIFCWNFFFFFWMMEVCVDGTFFAFTGRSGLVTWPELTSFFTLKRNRKHGFSFFFLVGGETLVKADRLKRSSVLDRWETMSCEEIFHWIGIFQLAD